MTRLAGLIILSSVVVIAATPPAPTQTAGPKAPTALTVTAATSKAVTLSWTGDPAPAKFIVERKGLGTAWPAPPTPPAPGAPARDPNAPLTPATIAAVTALTVTDSKIDALATYVYRIRAVGAADALSAPSNEVTVGPPPVGFTSIVAAPKAMHEADPTTFAGQIRFVFDSNGDPAVVYMNFDLNHDGDPKDSELAIETWDRAHYKWHAPVRIDDVGNTTRSGAREPLAAAHDDSTGRIGVLYLFDEHDLRLALSSDNGATWKTSSVQKTPSEEGHMATPSLAMAGGTAYAAYFTGGVGIRYRTGPETDAPSSWTSTTAPLLAGVQEPRAEGVSLVLDGAGKPGLIYLMNTGDYNVAMVWWRPGNSAPIKVADTDNHQTDDPAAQAAASGTQIGVVFFANRDDKFFENHHLWFIRSTDSGATWSAPVAVADDGNANMGWPFDIALDKAGHAAITAQRTGGNSDGVKCGAPKLMRSTDGLKWTACAPETRGTDPNADPASPVLGFAANGKLYVAFATRNAVPGLPAGLALWRER